MKHTYLNLDVDDIKISSIIEAHISKFNKAISIEDFKKAIVELDLIDNGQLCEYDDDTISECYNNLGYICDAQIKTLMSDTHMLQRGSTIGEFMIFFKLFKLLI